MTFLRWTWALPGTLIGWALACFLRREIRSIPGPSVGVEIIGVPWLIPKWAAAQTWGRIILRVDRYWTPRMWCHELKHVAQWDRLGPFMFIAYPLASLIALCCGKHYYTDNFFEVQAALAEGECLSYVREADALEKEYLG